MKFPTKYDHFGYGWLQKIKQGYHPGIDFNFGAPYEDEGQDVIAISDGVVTHARFCKGWGHHIIIYHPQYNIYSHYAHLESYCIKESENIKEGQLIGALGSTGGDWAPHLHFEIRLKNIPPNKYVNNMTVEEIQATYANPEEWIREKIQSEQNKLKIDNQFNKTMKLIKNTSSNKVYAIGNDGKKHWILNEETFDTGKEMGLWGDKNEIEVKNDDGYAEGYILLLIKNA